MRNTRVLAMGLALVVSTTMAMAAPKVKPKPKPATKPVVKVAPGVKGTAQMAGDNGKIGVTYTIGKNQPLNFTLISAEYSVTRVAQEDGLSIPKADEKLLMLHYTIQNPNKEIIAYNWGSLTFTAVDSENTNRESEGLVLKEDTAQKGTWQKYSMDLKPAQKIDVMTPFIIPAKASIPKIIVQHGDEQPVLRLYLAKNDIKPLSAPFADPSEPNGFVPRANVPGEIGVSYPYACYDVTVVGVDYATETLGEAELSEDKKFAVVTITVKNQTKTEKELNWGTFYVQVKTDDGEKTDPTNPTILKTKRNEQYSSMVPAGEEYTFRAVIEIPKDVKASEVTVWEMVGTRKYTFKVK